MTSVSILIPTHNRCEILARTLDSLAAIDIPDDVQVDLTVIASACTDDTESVVVAKIPHMPYPTRFIDEPTVGANVARNRGVRETAGEIIANLDDDVWVYPNWLTELLAIYKDYPADIVGGRVSLWWDAVAEPQWVSAVEGLLSANERGDKVFEVAGDEIIGANFSYKRVVWETIGGFHEKIDRIGESLLGGFEAVFLNRAREHGFRAFYGPGSLVKHWVAPHRITREYLDKIARSKGETMIRMKPRYKFKTLLRSFFGYGLLMLRHGLGELWAGIQGNQTNWWYHRSRRLIGVGGFVTLMRRITNRLDAPSG